MEVLLTLLVVAVFISVVGGMTLVMNEAQSSTVETRAAHMARQMISDLTMFNAPVSTPPSPVTTSSAVGSSASAAGASATPKGATIGIPLGAPTGALVTAVAAQGCTVQSIQLTAPGSFSASFDANGVPIAPTDPGCAYLASMTLTPNATRGGLSQVEVKIWPSYIQSINTHVLPWSPPPYRFVTAINIPTTQLPSNP